MCIGVACTVVFSPRNIREKEAIGCWNTRANFEGMVNLSKKRKVIREPSPDFHRLERTDIFFDR